MKHKTAYLLSGLAVVNVFLIIGLSFMILNNRQKANDVLPITTKEITLAQVKKHAIAEDCWTIIGSKVYDLTPYIGKNPQDKSLISACGTDGTAIVLPSGQTEQNSKTNKILEAYFIGIIAP